MSWAELSYLGVTIRPFSRPKPPAAGNYSPFTASLSQTMGLLERELRMLDASKIIIEAGFTESQLRSDGLPRADARMNEPAIALTFESRHGPLRYATAEYSDWQSNLRAIALSMEALRAVDRHGVSKRGEQYVGWRELTAKSSQPADFIVTKEDATQFLNNHGGSFKAAAAKLHPDRGGDSALFQAAVRAREILEEN